MAGSMIHLRRVKGGREEGSECTFSTLLALNKLNITPRVMKTEPYIVSIPSDTPNKQTNNKETHLATLLINNIIYYLFKIYSNIISVIFKKSAL